MVTLYIKEFWSLGLLSNIFANKVFSSCLRLSFCKETVKSQEKNVYY